MQSSVEEKIDKLFQTGFFHIFGSSVVNKIMNFLSSVILVRLVSKSEYGVYSYALNIYSLLLIFSGLGIEPAVMQAGCENRYNDETREDIYAFGIKYGTKVNCMLAIIFIFISLVIPLPITGAGNILVMLSFLPVLSFWYGMQMVYLRINIKNRHYSIMTTINTALVTMGTITGALSGGINGVVVSRYLAMGASILVSYVLYHVPLFIKCNSLNKGEKSDLLGIATISLVNNGLSQILFLLDVFVIGLVMMDENAVAIYKTATQIPNALTFIPSCIVVYIYPFFASHNKEPIWCLKRYRQLLGVMSVTNAFISVALVLFAPIIITLIFGRQYIDAVSVFRILSVSYFFSGTFRIIAGNLLVTQRKLKYNMFVAVLSGLVNIIADFCFIHFWGGVGAALATFLVVFITSTMTVCYYVYTLKKNIRISV